MSSRKSRRDFLKTAAAAGLAVWVSNGSQAQTSTSPNEQLGFGCIGVGGKGDSDTSDAARFGNVVAICDVDDNTLAKAALKYPNARKFNDYRKMLETMNKDIDAVTVSIPDHNHAPAAAMAMRMGKHCFCQKPLAHSVSEIRRLGEIALEMKVATEMGNQGTADNSMRKNAALVRAGAIGTPLEVHVWTNRPIWPQGIPRPASAPVPPTLHWALWLGPAPNRPFAPGYHPFAWRGFWDFGTGALGDMGCHTVNLPFMALDLRNPVTMRAESSADNRESYPKSSVIHYQFAATDTRPPVTMTWYDGGNLPPQDLLPGQKYSDSGSLIIGEKGKLYTPGDYGGGGTFIGGTGMTDVAFDESPGHWEEFIRAIKGGKPATSNFPYYAGPLAETVVLGNLAVWAAGRIVGWDAANMRAHNAPDANHIIRPQLHHGYRV